MINISVGHTYESNADVIREIRAGRKIEAIKVYRRIYGVPLKEAKDACEAIGAALQSVPAAPKFKVGDKVEHKHNKDAGVATVEFDYGNGRYQVRFPTWYGACHEREEDLVLHKTGTFIVAVFENGKYRPNSNPFIHTDESAAIAEAERLSKQHTGQKFGTFALIADSETPPSDTKTVRV